MERLYRSDNCHAALPPLDIIGQTEASRELAAEVQPISRLCNLDRIQALEDADIPYAVFAGAHVAQFAGNRPVGDIDITIDENSFDAVCSLEPFKNAQIYEFHTLDDPAQQASFLRIGDIEMRAGTDGTPGRFAFTSLVKNNCAPQTVIAENGQPIEVTFAPAGETFLFKLAMWRGKDEADVYALLANIKLDKKYLAARIAETRIWDQVAGRFGELDAMCEDIAAHLSVPPAQEELLKILAENKAAITHFVKLSKKPLYDQPAIR